MSYKISITVLFCIFSLKGVDYTTTYKLNQLESKIQSLESKVRNLENHIKEVESKNKDLEREIKKLKGTYNGY